jgi:choline dehydrogenase-like flavoprotein
VVVAKELSTAGFRVVVLEQGPWHTVRDFIHDEVAIFDRSLLSNDWARSPNTFRATEKETAKVKPSLGAKKLGYKPFPAPIAIASRPYDGRSQCAQCGFCLGFGCEVRAKSSSLVTVIPKAVATGRCEIRPHAYVRKIETDARGRVTGVKYFDADKRDVFQRAKAVVVCANGAETPKLLLNSKSNLFPKWLASTSGIVGKHLMFNGAGLSTGVFEHEVNGYKGLIATRVVWDLYELDPKLGLHGGGGFDYRFDTPPIQFANGGLPTDAPKWGAEFKKLLRHNYTRTIYCFGHTTSLPVPANSISLDPTVKDEWGVPAIRMTYRDHPQDLKLNDYFAERGEEMLEASGAVKTWREKATSQSFSVHLLGTCRMGNDPKSSVVDKFNRAHDVKNLFVVDGSSLVTSGRGQPTMTIQALAFRAGENIARFAKRGEI